MIKVSTTGMAVSLKTDLRFPISGQWGHGDRIIHDGYTKEMAYDDLFHGIIESIVYPRDKVYSDKSLYNEALEEAERRKSENMKKLYSYQILKS